MDFADVLTDWETLLKVNYQPIFADAVQMVTAIATDDRLVNELLSILCKAANDLVKTRLAQIHELAGEVFQKLIVDRKYVKANYTLPTSAALLSTLVCPKLPDGRLPKVADFACGQVRCSTGFTNGCNGSMNSKAIKTARTSIKRC